MEHIYKIKIRSNPDQRGLYPSERRYSASTVLGLSVVHIALAITALLMASLNLSTNNRLSDSTVIINLNPNLSAAPCVLSLGALTAGLTGLIAWKRWYIDHNIRWFFLTTILSTISATICVIMTTVTIVTVYEKHKQSGYDFAQRKPNIRFILALNILIAGALELIWSVLSARVAYVGMMNTYPDDMVISRNRGKIEVNTVQYGNKKNKVVPPDILDHFPKTGKLAKYLPKNSDRNLPKDESNSEYQERVRQFLCSNSCNSISNSDIQDLSVSKL